MPLRFLLAVSALSLASCSEHNNGATADAGVSPDTGSSDMSATFDAPIEATDMPIAMDASFPDVFVPFEDVDVVITADNAYRFGWGDMTALDNYLGHASSSDACDIFCCDIGRGPERHTIPGEDAPEGAYLYIVTWADNSTSQGVIGQFIRGSAGIPTYTGTDVWEVCATGVAYPGSSDGPPIEEVNAQLTICNEGTGDPATTSAGWVDAAGAVTEGAVGRLAIGEDNKTDRTSITPGNEFPIVCQMDSTGARGVDPDARWMWYDWGSVPATSTPFIFPGGGTTNPLKQFLIFRLPADVIIF